MLPRQTQRQRLGAGAEPGAAERSAAARRAPAGGPGGWGEAGGTNAGSGGGRALVHRGQTAGSCPPRGGLHPALPVLLPGAAPGHRGSESLWGTCGVSLAGRQTAGPRSSRSVLRSTLAASFIPQLREKGMAPSHQGLPFIAVRMENKQDSCLPYAGHYEHKPRWLNPRSRGQSRQRAQPGEAPPPPQPQTRHPCRTATLTCRLRTCSCQGNGSHHNYGPRELEPLRTAASLLAETRGRARDTHGGKDPHGKPGEHGSQTANARHLL